MNEHTYIVCQSTSQGGDYALCAAFDSEEKAKIFIEDDVKARYDQTSWYLVWWSESRHEHKPSWDWWHKQASSEYWIETLPLNPSKKP